MAGPMLNETLARILKAKARRGGGLRGPAQEASIKEAQRYFSSRGTVLAPSYKALLCQHDGVEFNGQTFYSVHQEQHPNGRWTLGLIETNSVFVEPNPVHILYGENGDDLFCQNIETNEWTVVDKASGDELEAYDSFDALFNAVFEPGLIHLQL